MTPRIKNLFAPPVLIAGFGLILAGRVLAQTFTTIHSFTALNNFTNSDGVHPYGGLILSGNTLYGTTSQGGSSFQGTVFKVNTDGLGIMNLHSFAGYPDDGGSPYAGLILSGNTLYGTAPQGGGSGHNGALFAVNTNGTGYTNLYKFSASAGFPPMNNDGASPNGGLILSGKTIYGTATYGGNSGNGTVFSVNTNGTGFTTLHSFTATPAGTNSDGANPYGSLILSGTTLYGTAQTGGSLGNGTIFAVNTNGTGFTNLHTFTGFPNEGRYLDAGLILSSNMLYGTTGYGGSSENGTVFAVNTNGTGFTNLHSFTTTSGPNSSNSDGAYPPAGVIISGSTLYGTATFGGSSGNGTVFAVNTDGTGFKNLHSFTPIPPSYSTNSDGARPNAGLILSGNILYGTAYQGGGFGNGTVFSLSLGAVSAPQPQLTIICSGTNVILTWPTNAVGFTLQSTTNLVSPAAWISVSPTPIVVNGQNAVTNPISGSQKFYRLSQ